MKVERETSCVVRDSKRESQGFTYHASRTTLQE
jgi:hypothetical protein